MSRTQCGRLCIVEPCARGVSETFLTAQAENIPAEVTVVQGRMPVIQNEAHPRLERVKRALRRFQRFVHRQSLEWEVTSAFVDAFRRSRAEAVLAQYGPTGVRVLTACRETRLPLIVHFHGADATMQSIVEANREGYRDIFEYASAIIAVSRQMERQLIALGAPLERVQYSPYGVHCGQFGGSKPAKSSPTFLAVGRLVEKKAPILMINAFALVHDRCPEAKLKIIGDGQLMENCRRAIKDLRIGHAVDLLGEQPHAIVAREMQRARAFVQHSIQAPNGDSEGTPVAILEASASQLPIVSTRHAGIVEAVVEGETGFLVDEGDVEGMAVHMLRLAEDPQIASRLGCAGRRHMEENYRVEKSVGRLWSIIEACIERHQGARLSSNGKPYVVSNG